MPAGRGPAGKEINTMAKKSTKSTRSNAKAAAGKSTKSTKKGKSASERIMEKFQVTDIPGAPSVAAQPTAETTAVAEAAPVAIGGDPAGESTTTTTAPAGGDTGEPGATGGKRMGILSAAVRVLEEHDGPEPLNCQQMVERMMAQGYWSPRRNGLTPPATLYSGIIREIKEKANNSRFKKVDRGRFALNR